VIRDSDLVINFGYDEEENRRRAPPPPTNKVRLAYASETRADTHVTLQTRSSRYTNLLPSSSTVAFLSAAPPSSPSPAAQHSSMARPVRLEVREPADDFLELSEATEASLLVLLGGAAAATVEVVATSVTSVNKTKAKLAAVIRARKIEEAIAAARCRQWHLLCDTLWGKSADTNAGYDGYEQSLEAGTRYFFHGRIIPRSARCPV